MQAITADALYAQLYDLRVPDWEGEVDFYRELAGGARKAQGVLELACGTGRIALRLAREGVEVTGFDLSPLLLEEARLKSTGMPNVRWELADMRAFEMGRKFGLVISPGHSFQFMTTPNDQVACLECVRRHLVPGGLAVFHIDHQDYSWLAGLLRQPQPVFETGRTLVHPVNGRKFRPSSAWRFQPSTQTATVVTRWEEIGEDGQAAGNWEMDAMHLHCIFPFEMEHLLKRTGFCVEAVYGDFFKGPLVDTSGQMIWLARNPEG